MDERLKRLFWQGTALLLAAHFAGWTAALPLVLWLNALQVLHFVALRRSLRAFDVQVRLAYLLLLFAGTAEALWPIHVLQFVGVNALLVADYCPLARLLVLLPWNRRVPLSGALLRWLAFSPPAPGAIVARLPEAAPAVALRPGPWPPWAPAAPWHRPASVAVLLTGLAAAGCTGLPQDVERTASWAVHSSGDTPVSRLVDASTPDDQRHLSGFRLLADGADALATRLALVRAARHSLDLQYFMFEADATGELLLRELRTAAERGVRVRLLVDDLHAGGHETELAALDRHARAEVRLFNPLPARGASMVRRVLWSLHDFDRINRRMHNKLFVADGRLALAGGRNIGNDYFMRGTLANFIDLDILSTGPVVVDLADLFDRFWNHALSYPIRSLVPAAAADVAAAAGGAAQASAMPASRDPLDADTAAQIASGRLELQFATVRLLADEPDKAVRADAADQPGETMAQALALMRAAQTDVMIASPYFIPGPLGLELLREASDRGIDIAVMTNSLGATDEPLAYRGYRRYRMSMLKMGVKLAELSPVHTSAPQEHGVLRSSMGRLHAKFAVVDQRWLLVGSLNMDRRSSRINTELALAIDSPALAAEAAALLHQLWTRNNYQLRLTPAEDRIEWIAHEGKQMVVHQAEPHVDWVGQWRLGLLSALVPEELL